MKPLLKGVGAVIFWFAWPFWLVYFRLNSRRSRVLVVCQGELLLVNGWLGRGKWGLPGGGAKRSEALESSACRELMEEVGIKTLPSELIPLGEHRHREAGLTYNASYFLLKLSEKPKLKVQKHEIAEAGWFGQKAVADLSLNQDTVYALTEYGNKIWYN